MIGVSANMRYVSDEEEAEIQRQIAADPDDEELSGKRRAPHDLHRGDAAPAQPAASRNLECRRILIRLTLFSDYHEAAGRAGKLA